VEPDEDIRYFFLKPEQTSKFKNRKLSFHRSVFEKPTSAVWEQFCTSSHSQFIFQHDRINTPSIFLCAMQGETEANKAVIEQ